MKECKPELTDEEFSKNITPIVQVINGFINIEELVLKKLSLSLRSYPSNICEMLENVRIHSLLLIRKS